MRTVKTKLTLLVAILSTCSFSACQLITEPLIAARKARRAASSPTASSYTAPVKQMGTFKVENYASDSSDNPRSKKPELKEEPEPRIIRRTPEFIMKLGDEIVNSAHRQGGGLGSIVERKWMSIKREANISRLRAKAEGARVDLERAKQRNSIFEQDLYMTVYQLYQIRLLALGVKNPGVSP